jgi:predicted ATP-dependent protease
MIPLTEPIETLSLNKETCKLEWKQIKYVYRHKTKEQLFKFTLETGRQVTVTGDHSIFILQNGKPTVKPARQLAKNNCVLIPRKIPTQNKHHVSLEAARLLGYYIAEGHVRGDKGSYKIEFTLHKKEQHIIDDIKHCARICLSAEARVYPHGENGARTIIYGKHAHNLFTFLLGDIHDKKAKTKGIPLCIINAQSEAQEEFIKAYIAGDAGVTKSRRLMSELLYLFLQNNIIATVQQREDTKQAIIRGRTIKSTGERYDLKSPKTNRPCQARYNLPPFEALSKNTIRAFFKEAISSEYKRATPERAENTLLLARLKALNSGSLHGKQFKELFGQCTLEYARDHPDLFNVQKVGREALVSITEQGKYALAGLEQIEKLASSDLGFARIKRIERVTSSNEFVYDVSVPGYESFVGGFGGIICHNSGAGLSAAVVKDEFLQGWSLEAGALVLANRGLCCIDELDKMSKEDGWAMHEALEQQSITISKANIQASLRCETTVLAAANPKFGRFDPYDTIANQINLAPTLINRFDLIFPIKDVTEQTKDEKMAHFILELHKNNVEKPEIETRLLRKYLAYSRQNIFPKLTDAAIEELRDYYLKMRATAGGEGIKSIPISARQLEGLVRLSEASARLRLSDKVTKKDAKKAVELLDYCLRQVALDEETGTFDIDRIATDMPASSRNKLIIIKEIIQELETKLGKTIPAEDIIRAAGEKDITESEAEEILQKLKRAGDIFEPRRGFISRI